MDLSKQRQALLAAFQQASKRWPCDSKNHWNRRMCEPTLFACVGLVWAQWYLMLMMQGERRSSRAG